MIPKVLHQIWVGERSMPADIALLCQKMREAHPQWEYKLWTNEQYPQDIPANFWPIINRSREVSRNGRNMGATEADLLRYLILHRTGGVYLDCDFRVTGSLDVLDLSKDLIMCSPNSKVHWVCNGALAATPGHALFASALAEATLTPHLYYGPDYLTNIFKKLKGLPSGNASNLAKMRSCLNSQEEILDQIFFLAKTQP